MVERNTFSAEPQGSLLVFEYGGTGRSGKGTIVSHLAETHEGVATEETGADYRAVTKALLEAGVIEVGMPPRTIARRIGKVPVGALTEYVAGRHAILKQYGFDALYASDVKTTVSDVSPILSVRKAVKSGFKKRVEAVRDNDGFHTLLVDGRNLDKVVQAIPGTQLLMRTFVTCLPSEGAWRESDRQLAKTGTSQPFMEICAEIEARNSADASRKIDPVVPDKNAIDYWYDPDSVRWTYQQIADDMYDGDYMAAVSGVTHPDREFTDVPRHTVGTRAYLHRQQIHFDTSPYRNYDDPRGGMLTAADIMFTEAMDTHERTMDALRTALRKVLPSDLF